MRQAHASAASAVYGRYQTLFRIAAGGMAEVYAARVRGEAGFQKLVAVKRMLPHLTDDERFVTMFMDEGKLAAHIDSPNVVSTMDLGRADDGSLYLVMELVVGTTLSTLLRNAAKEGDSVPIDIACEMLAQAGQGLHDAHEAKTPDGAPLQLVHRDISPQNILVGIDGRVRITDFGVARAVLRRTKTSTGEFKGKLSYFSPEQCADRDLDRRSDLFSLGVVAWETLTTRRLFHAENPLAVLERVTRMPIPSAHSVRPDVPVAVARVVARALERDRDARYASAAEFASALREAARDSVGPIEHGRISELVQKHGGSSLERIQAQLKESLANPALVSDHTEIDTEPTEISSGIVIRPDEAGFAGPDGSGSMRFAYAADMVPTAKIRRSNTPLVIAAIVALLGLAGGAIIGIIASDSDTAPDATTAVRLPTGVTPVASPPVEEPPPAATPEPAPPAAEIAAPVEAPEPTGVPSTAAERPRRIRRPEHLQPRIQPLIETHPNPGPRPVPGPRPQPRGNQIIRGLDSFDHETGGAR